MKPYPQIDRLLSEEEMELIKTVYFMGELTTDRLVTSVAKCQLSKDDKWWLDKCDKVFGTVAPDCWMQDGCGTDKCVCEYQKWQQLKTEIGVK